MLKDCVLVLGSGKSILDLSPEERKLLNSCDVKIAINKFAGFYEKAEIEPTDIYFVDNYDASSKMMLNYIFKLFCKKNLKSKTFIVSIDHKGFLFRNHSLHIVYKEFNYKKEYLFRFFVKLGRFFLKKISVSQFNKLHFWLSQSLISYPDYSYSVLPKKSKIYYIKIQNCIAKGNKWSKSLEEPLYHFKGSFSTVLNYISICYPNKIILLAGVDFNSSDYFFEEDLEKLDFDTKDWTYDIKKSHNKHFSIIETEGLKMDDELPFMLSELEKSNNKVYSLNKYSYLVEQKYIDYISLNDVNMIKGP